LGGSAYQEAGSWSLGVTHRWQYSDKHYVGDEEQVYREKEGSQVINDIHVIDVNVGYNINKRVAVSMSIPFQKATRSQALRDPRFLRDANGAPVKDANGNNVFLNPSGVRTSTGSTNGAVIARYRTEAEGLADMKLFATAWVLDPEKAEKGNISVGLGVVLPTGESDHLDTFKTLTTKRGGKGVNDTYTINDTAQYVDNSIEPGTGAWGIIFDLYMWRQLRKDITVFASGTYIATPQELSGNPNGGIGTTNYWSANDAYLFRAGGGYTFWPSGSMTFTLAGRMEGSPSTDLIGGSAGRRRPGFAIAIEPGLVFARKGWVVAFSTPVALYRNRENDFSGKEGDAAFADFITLLSVSKRF